jgi:hypothetical protein
MGAERELTDAERYELYRILCAEYSFLAELDGDIIHLGMTVLTYDLNNLCDKLLVIKKNLFRSLHYANSGRFVNRSLVKNHNVQKPRIKKMYTKNNLRFSQRCNDHEILYNQYIYEYTANEYNKKQVIFNTVWKQLVDTKYLAHDG